MTTDGLDAQYEEFVALATTPVFPRSYIRFLASSIPGISYLRSRCLFPVCRTRRPSPGSRRRRSQQDVHRARPACCSTESRRLRSAKYTLAESAQPQVTNLSTAALETTSFALAANHGSVGMGTDNASPRTPANPKPLFHDDATDVGVLPRLPSTSQGHPSSLVPSEAVSTRTQRHQAVAAGCPIPEVD